MKLIGLVGQKQSGKDTCFGFFKQLAERENLRCIRYAFADTLKAEVSSLLGVSLAQIEQDKGVFRPFLQWYGTDFIRQYKKQPLYWINKIDKQLDKARGTEHVIVLTDVRYANEADLVIRYGGKLVKVTRPVISADFHSSETDLAAIHCDDLIQNNSSLSELQFEVEAVWNRL